MTKVLYAGLNKYLPLYKKHFYDIDPTIIFVDDISVVNKEEIDFILYSIDGDLDSFSGFTNLSAVFSLWAGIDALLKNETLQANVPIFKMEEEGLTMGMSDYVVGNVFRIHLGMLKQQQNQSESFWESNVGYKLSPNRRVGIFGLGPLGTDVAKQLVANRFNVSAWSRSKKYIDRVTCFSGFSSLTNFFSKIEILVLLAPATVETNNIINNNTLAMLSPGSSIINVARGSLVNEDDLLSFLDSGHIDTAILDVFKTEPLAKEHKFWKHPKVIITPHCASDTRPASASLAIINIIHTWQNGKVLENNF